jgi:hypothetical protein
MSRVGNLDFDSDALTRRTVVAPNVGDIVLKFKAMASLE